jgi:hypothetical protein
MVSRPPAGQDLFEKALTEGAVPTPPKTFDYLVDFSYYFL